jgi:hypothetical protein
MLHTILICWFALGVISAIVIWFTMLPEISNSSTAKLAISCLAASFLGLISAFVAFVLVLAGVKIAKARAWWKGLGLQRQCELTGIPLSTALRSGGIEPTDQEMFALYSKHGSKKK